MNYIMNVMTITAAAGIVEMAVRNGKFSKHIRIILSLCIISALISPVISLNAKLDPGGMFNVGEAEKYEWDDSELKEKVTVNIEKSIISAIEKKFDIRNISVSAETSPDDNGEYNIDMIVITFKDKGEWYRSGDVKKYVEELMQAKTEVKLEDR